MTGMFRDRGRVWRTRRWNRAYGQVRFYGDHVRIDVRPWYRVPERQKASPEDTRGDDNPDILRYLGNGELSLEYQNGKADFVLTGWNNLRSSPNYGAIQLDVIYALDKQFRLYVQYFSGYGESLIDYNRYQERIGAGVMFASWR
jgi:phospholipase A1